jgi:hypothetical protein
MITSCKSLWWWLTLGCCWVSFLAASLSAQAQERQLAAELIALIGKAEIKSPGETQFRPTKVLDKLYPQDQIRTLADSRVKLFFQDESVLVLGDNTTLDIAKFQMNHKGQRESALMKLVHGSLRFIVQQVAAGVTPNFEIQSKTAIMEIRGTDGVFESRSPDRITFLGGNTILIIRNLTTGQTLTLTPNKFVIVTPGQPMRTGIVAPQMRQQLSGYFQMTQSFVPGNVSSPGLPPPALMAALQRMGMTFGNPLLPQTDQFRNLFNPAAQGNGTPQTPLPAMHQPLLPR